MIDWFKNISFAYPYLFGLFAILPLLIFWHIKKNNQQQAILPVTTINAFTTSSLKQQLRFLPFLFRLLTIAALIIALARPQKRDDDYRKEGNGIDIVLCIDVSGSMGSKDVLPSRIAVAKEMAIEFVQNRPVDRIGLVVFSDQSFTQCPVTTNKAVLISQIQSLESRLFFKDGTVIGEGLATAVARLQKSKAKSKVIILLTDGKEDPPDTRLIDPVTALEIAKTERVKVYTIGIGGMPIAAVNTSGTFSKKAATDFLDEALLKKMADETGGRFFRARDREALRYTYTQIDKMEKSKIEMQALKRYQEKFFPFMLIALCCLGIEIILNFTLFKKFP